MALNYPYRYRRFHRQSLPNLSTSMGMTKAIQERIYGRANLDCPQARFACVRYGNVLARVVRFIPLFHEQIASGSPVTITTETTDEISLAAGPCR